MQGAVCGRCAAARGAWPSSGQLASQPRSSPTCPLAAHCRLVKAGLLPQRYAPALARVSNWGELIGYVGSITLW